MTFDASHESTAWDSDAALSVREAGAGSFPAPEMESMGDERSQMPAGNARFPVPPYQGFVGLTGMPFRAHNWQVDEALKHSRANADAMLKDILILTSLEDRFRPASQVSWIVNALDETDNAQMRAAIKNTLAISKTFKLQESFFQHQRGGKWYGKFGIAHSYRWDKYNPDLMCSVNWTPINGDSLVPRWATNEWGQLVNFSYEGKTDNYSIGGRVHWYDASDMESVVIHSHRPTQPDFFDQQSSGQLAGLGIRHGCFWIWYYRANLLSLLMDYVERLSSGIWVGWYDESNPEGRADLERAVAAYKAKSLLSMPMRRDGTKVCELEIKEVGSASSAVMRETLEYVDNLLRSYILGQPYQPGNIGGDEVAMRDGSISTVTKADCEGLSEDYTTGWLPTLYRYNSPGVPVGSFQYNIDHPNAEKLLNYAVTMRQLGWNVDLDHLAKVTGLPRGSLNATISTKIQPLSPVALNDGPPQDVPVAGNTPSAPVQSPNTSPPSTLPQ